MMGSKLGLRLKALNVIWIAAETLLLAALGGLTVGHEVNWLAGVAVAAACAWVVLGWVHGKDLKRLLGLDEPKDVA